MEAVREINRIQGGVVHSSQSVSLPQPRAEPEAPRDFKLPSPQNRPLSGQRQCRADTDAGYNCTPCGQWQSRGGPPAAGGQGLQRHAGAIHAGIPRTLYQHTTCRLIFCSEIPSVLSGINRIQRWSQSKPLYLVLIHFFVSVYSIQSREQRCYQE